MIGEMRSAALLAKAVAGNPAALPARQVLRMATLQGAQALGLDDAIGSIEPGKRADLVAVDLSVSPPSGLRSVSQLVYAASRDHVRQVWLDGRRRVRDGELVDMDVPAILERAQQWRGRIAGAAT